MRSGVEYRWILKGYTPETIPMKRLGDYMTELGKLFGMDQYVHFVRVEKNCVAVVTNVEYGAPAQEVNKRLAAVRRGDGAGDAMRAHDNLSNLLIQDKKSALLKAGSATIISFPRIKKSTIQQITVRDSGSLVGHLLRLGQYGNKFRATLVYARKNIDCDTTQEAANKLRSLLFGNVRVYGTGEWIRSDGGVWDLNKFSISDAHHVKNMTLRTSINHLRDQNWSWPDDPLLQLAELEDNGFDVQ